MWAPEELVRIAEEMKTGGKASGYTTRDLLQWFGAERRGRHIVAMIKRALKGLELTTAPNFEYAYIDAPLSFGVLTNAVDGGSDDSAVIAAESPILGANAVDDPTYRIGKLESANTTPVTVVPQATIEHAVTQMLYHDFSQLPVMQGERDLKGGVSWQSIGKALALGHRCETVQDCLEEVTTISSDTSLFAAIPAIVDRQYVLIRDESQRIGGIVTTTDLSLQFRQLAEPFLLLGEIENHLRILSDGKFTKEEVAAVMDPGDATREINDLADLTFGEHLRLLENPDRWDALLLRIDRGTFVNHLDDVRMVRNNVMHFDPDGVAPEDLTKLRNFTRLLVSLRVD